MTKSAYERVSDFIDHWNPDFAGRYEILLKDGRRVVIQDCYLSRDQAGRPDIIWVNHDSPRHDKYEFDPLDVIEITDL
jgi:hypothetical protein